MIEFLNSDFACDLVLIRINTVKLSRQLDARNEAPMCISSSVNKL